MRVHNPDSVVATGGRYAHGIETPLGGRILYVSGQVGITRDLYIPETIFHQAEIIWNNIAEVLNSAKIKFDNIVKINTYVVTGHDALQAVEVQRRHLGIHAPAHTLVYVAGLIRPQFFLEVEVVAIAGSGEGAVS